LLAGITSPVIGPDRPFTINRCICINIATVFGLDTRVQMRAESFNASFHFTDVAWRLTADFHIDFRSLAAREFGLSYDLVQVVGRWYG
jgi:hypothetical protein